MTFAGGQLDERGDSKTGITTQKGREMTPPKALAHLNC